MIFGREHELRTLTAAYEQMLAGRGSVLFLTGEAGLGKTTLVHSWKSGTLENAQRDEGRGLRDEDSGMRAEGRGLRDEEISLSLIPHPSTLFLESACSIPIGNVDVGRLEALQPWADVIAQAQEKIDQTDRTDRTDHSGKKKLDFKKLIHEAAPAWAWAIPFVGDIAHAALETSRLVKEQRGDFEAPQAAQNQQQVFQQYVNLLTKVAEVTPLVIFLDDMHWADTSSCNLLFYLSRQIADKKILVICTYRQDDAVAAQEGKGHPILSVKNEILRYKTGTEHKLSYLTADAVASILVRSFPSFPSIASLPDTQRFLAWLLKISDGNSLFVTQLIETLKEDGHFTSDGQFTGNYDDVKIPGSALAVVEERTRRLDEDTRQLLCYATAEGEEFTSYVLGKLTERAPLQLLKDLKKAQRFDMIREKGTARLMANQTTTVFGFSHALFHQALYNELGQEERSILHHQCYGLLKEEWDRHAGTLQRSITLATKLLTHAEKSREHATVAEVALAAAQELWKSYNEEEALAMIARARAAMEFGPAAPVLSAETDFLEGRICTLRGRFEEAIAAYHRADKTFRTAHAIPRAIDTAVQIGWCCGNTGQYEKGLDTALHAIKEASDVGYSKGQGAALNVVSVMYSKMGRNIEALEKGRESLAVHQSIDDRSGEASALNNIGITCLNLGRFPEATDCFQKSLLIQESLDDRPGMASSLMNIGLVHSHINREGLALEYFEKGLVIQESTGDRAGVAASMVNIGTAHYARGSYDEALRYFVRGLELSEAIGHKQWQINALGNIGSVHADQARYADAISYFERAHGMQKSIGDRNGQAHTLHGLGRSYRGLGEYALSRDHLTRALALTRELGIRGVECFTVAELGLLAADEARAVTGDAQAQKFAEARRLILEAIEVFRSIGDLAQVDIWTSALGDLES